MHGGKGRPWETNMRWTNMETKVHATRALTSACLALALAVAVLALSACAPAPENRDATTVGTPTAVAEAQQSAAPATAVPAGAGTAPAAAPAGGAHPDTVARVNGDPVTRDELQRMLADPLERRELELELGAQGRDGRAVERLAMRNLINRRLILQEAARRNFTVTEQELDQALTALLHRFEDLGSFGVWMKERGLDERSLFETMRGEILTERVRAALVQGLRVGEDEIQKLYDAHQADLKTEEVWIQIIAVKDEAAAEEVQAALEKGEDFGRVAQQRSMGLRAAQGGDVGWVDAETLWPPLRDAIHTLKPREAVGPLQRGEEFLTVRLQERRPGRPKTLAEARLEIEAGLLALKQKEVLQAWLVEQEKDSKIEIFP